MKRKSNIHKYWTSRFGSIKPIAFFMQPENRPGRIQFSICWRIRFTRTIISRLSRPDLRASQEMSTQANDPRQPSAAKPFVAPAVNPQDLPVDYSGFIAVVFGIAGVMFRVFSVSFRVLTQGNYGDLTFLLIPHSSFGWNWTVQA